MNKSKLIKYALIVIYLCMYIAMINLIALYIIQIFGSETSFHFLGKFTEYYSNYIYKIPDQFLGYILLQSFTVYFFLLIKDIEFKAIPGVKMSPWISLANLIPAIQLVVVYILSQNIYRSYQSIKRSSFGSEKFSPPSSYLRALLAFLLISRVIILISFYNNYNFNPTISLLLNICSPIVMILFARYVYEAYQDSEKMHYGV
ncbi:hypothetical protein [Leptospira johnsonii]|uniref:Uncharacterized protein n=1 Tax=Leptospira johnsonii TaxID=1917820 RepID=A0A2P2D7M6_9LEPT|nr:hypothetical protein [Leptospira johnsonii]GBF40634.1 hypothetical protein LPTSP1_36520 [Leptospira johnsonii]